MPLPMQGPRRPGDGDASTGTGNAPIYSTMTAHFAFTNSYASLPPRFFASVVPTPVSGPKLIKVNHALARSLGLDPAWLESPEGVEVLAGKRLPDGAEPLAAAYAGHQFGNFVPQLGDGRAILLGEVVDDQGVRRDIQLKGSGPTPFSRGGDGRAALGPVLREYLVSEAMAALGIPSTRALAAVTTGDWVYREGALPGAVLTRVASSHVRVGSFQFFAARGDDDGVRVLADFVIARHYPDLAARPQPYRALLDAVIARQAALVARWLLVGFIHGVMNTDNMSVAGETIDYGPCAFMEAYDPETVFSSIDHGGRYAYGNQPRIAHWNLARLAETLLPLLGGGEQAVANATDAIDGFVPLFTAAYRDGLRKKLGLFTEREEDRALADHLFDLMALNKADFTLTFRALGEAAVADSGLERARNLFVDPTGFDAWAQRWRARIDDEGIDPQARRASMDRVNPAFIPRNHRVEAVIAAGLDGDYAPFEEMLSVLSRPYQDQPDRAIYAEPAPAGSGAYRTFCGT